MPIPVACPDCGKKFKVKDSSAGKRVRCPACETAVKVPSPDVEDGDELEILEELDEYGEDSADERPAKSTRGPARKPAKHKKARKSSGGSNLVLWIALGAGGGVAALVGLCCLVGMFAGGGGGATAAPFNVTDTPIPSLPELGPPLESGPQGTLYEVALTGSGPGGRMRIRVLLPPGEHAPQSLGAVFIAGAGSNMITGMGLDTSGFANPEHAPYLAAGRAVVHYTLDGELLDRENATDAEMKRCYLTFKDAQAGLVNFRNAWEFAAQKVVELDPQRFAIAGHSSAGTHALFVAAHEPRLKACAAYAPETDVETAFEGRVNFALVGLIFPGLRDFCRRVSPRTHIASFQCPVFLFHALDDSVVPVARTQEFARDMQAAGKTVQLQIVPNGDHYDSMVNQGVGSGARWIVDHTPPER